MKKILVVALAIIMVCMSLSLAACGWIPGLGGTSYDKISKYLDEDGVVDAEKISKQNGIKVDEDALNLLTSYVIPGYKYDVVDYIDAIECLPESYSYYSASLLGYDYIVEESWDASNHVRYRNTKDTIMDELEKYEQEDDYSEYIPSRTDQYFLYTEDDLISVICMKDEWIGKFFPYDMSPSKMAPGGSLASPWTYDGENKVYICEFKVGSNYEMKCTTKFLSKNVVSITQTADDGFGGDTIIEMLVVFEEQTVKVPKYTME